MAAVRWTGRQNQEGLIRKSSLLEALFYTNDKGGAERGTKPRSASPCLICRHMMHINLRPSRGVAGYNLYTVYGCNKRKVWNKKTSMIENCSSY